MPAPMIPEPTTPTRFTVMAPILLAGNLSTVSGAMMYDWMMAATEARGLAARRRHLLATARGRVLEIGAGTGLNLRHYRPEQVDSLVALEPDAAMRARLAARARTLAVPFEARAETIDEARLPEGGF